MCNMIKLVFAFALSLAVVPAYAGNDNGPTFFGDTTNNNQTYNNPSATATGGAGGAGGNGYGGAASATGGTAFGGSAAVGDIRNTANGGAGGSVLGSGNSSNTNLNTALGGAGGSAFQGQGQQQGQGQSQSNVGVNGQSQGIDSTIRNNVGTSTSTSTSTTTGQSQSANNAGNSQSVGGQSVTINEADIPDDVTIRSAPAVMVAAAPATASCYKTYGGSLSGILGGAGFSGGKLDQGCELREMVRITAGLDDEGARRLLCLDEMYSYANPGKCTAIRPVILVDGKAGRQLRANRAADAAK